MSRAVPQKLMDMHRLVESLTAEMGELRRLENMVALCGEPEVDHSQPVVVRLRSIIDGLITQRTRAESLQAENERLRAALKQAIYAAENAQPFYQNWRRRTFIFPHRATDDGNKQSYALRSPAPLSNRRMAHNLVMSAAGTMTRVLTFTPISNRRKILENHVDDTGQEQQRPGSSTGAGNLCSAR
jgi:hypothetical protein